MRIKDIGVGDDWFPDGTFHIIYERGILGNVLLV